MRRFRIAFDVSNFTAHRKKFMRTGIQEVVYRTFLSAVKLRHELSSAELILVPKVPKQLGGAIHGTTIIPYEQTPREIFELLEDDLKLPSEEIWGFDFRSKGFQLSDQESLEILSSSDAIHIQSLVAVGPLSDALDVGQTRPRWSMTLYDLVGALFPEYCDDSFSRWFNDLYLPGVGRVVGHGFAISRSTALDFQAHPVTRGVPKISILPLPLEAASSDGARVGLLDELGLAGVPYVVHLGSIEPRKNIDMLLSGFEAFHELHPGSPLKLVLVGGTGWKNEALRDRIRRSRFADSIRATGYLEDGDMVGVVRGASALAMLSQYEGYGLPVALANSQGVRVLTSYGSSLPEACGGEAIFVDPHDRFSVAAGIAVALDPKTPRPQVPSDLSQRTWDNYTRGLLGAILDDRG